MHRCGVLVAVVVLVASAAAPAWASEGLASPGSWVRPVDGEVVRPFVAPASPYGPGHRGVKLAAVPDTPVRAAGGGTVSFAGRVAGSLHVVVAHAGDLRTSYSYLGSATVRQGEQVERGQVVGTTTRGDHEPPDSLHFGLRHGDTYLDPMLLFEVSDLTELVRLIPATGEAPAPAWPRSTDQQHLLREFAGPPSWLLAHVDDDSSGGLGAIGGVASAISGGVSGAVAGAVDLASTAAGWTGEQLARAGVASLALAGDLGARAHEWAERHVPAVRVLEDLVEIGQRFAGWVEHRRSCDSDAAPADGTGGSNHSLLAVAGIDSATGAGSETFELDTDALGYDADEVHYFSYARDGGDYDHVDTRGDLQAAAERLGEQLRARQREDPGREVDLVAHSQGGVVVAAFLQHVYDPTDTAYPPIGTVITLASPHQGAPLATAVDDLDGTAAGAALLDGARSSGLGLPLGRSTAQLAEHSELVRDLWARPPYEQLQVTSIGATDDVVVPGNRTEVPESTVVTLAVGGLDDHSRILTDAESLRAVRAALERRDPPCVSFVDGVRGAVTPVVISRVETTLGELATTGARAVAG